MNSNCFMQQILLEQIIRIVNKNFSFKINETKKKKI